MHAGRIIARRSRAHGNLERNPRAHLNLAPGGHRHGDGAELRRVHEAVRRAQIYFVQRVEGFAAELEGGSFAEAEGACQGKIQSLQWRTIDGVSPNIAERASC